MARTTTAQTALPTTDTATATVTTEVATAATAPASHAAALVELREIAVADIATDGSNPRTLFDLDGEAGLRELAASIKAHGLVQPITVRANLDAGEGAPPYLLVAGERRLRATRDVLKRRTIAAIMRHDLTEDTALEATILENLQRRDLHPMEDARGLVQLRAGRGYTVEQIAKKLGRGKEWIKDRLKLCDLPAAAQDLYLRDTTGRLTLGRMLKLHEYTHGNRDNTGFPRLIEAMVEDMAGGHNPDAHPGTTATLHAGLVTRISHWRSAQGGAWGGHYFDTYSVCRTCPFAAFRNPYGGDYEGYCLMPDHYAELHAKGKAQWEEAEAARQKDAPAVMPGAGLITAGGPGGYTRPVEKTAAQKGKETRARRLAQKADYMPNVLAVRRSVDLIPSIEVHDLATLAAYSLAKISLNKEDWGEIARRHGVDVAALMRAGGSTRPSADHIKELRKLDPLALVKATIEALLIRQAQAARDYEPDNDHSAGPDPVFKLYTGDQTSASPTPPALPHDAGDTGHTAHTSVHAAA
jgi:ParB/RepB/Spo0J family partition protein